MEIKPIFFIESSKKYCIKQSIAIVFLLIIPSPGMFYQIILATFAITTYLPTQ